MAGSRVTRRDFGRLAGAVGAGSALAGVSLAPSPATARAAARQWRATGTAVTALKSFDDTMASFMQARNIPAGQLAVTYRGRLVLARGYAWSDDSTLTVTPTSLFRIASISKPVTAAAVARLVQDKQISLTTPVTSILTLTPPAGQSTDPRLSDVTVGRLLQHLGGWDAGRSGDPMFADRAVAKALGTALPVSQAAVVRYGAGRPLDHAPGSTYAYSNYGYLLLGQIIEAVSGTGYAAYVQQKILAPVGITRMALGRTLPAHRAATEMPYASQYTGTTVMDGSGATVPFPDGGFNLENMAAHGGWLGTAVDLVRFARVFDTPVATPVLDSTSLARVFAQPETGLDAGGSYYGLGWSVRPVGTGRNTWHSGSLAGTHTLLVRTYHGLSWAVLFNQRDDPSGQAYAAIDGSLWTAAGAVTAWPGTDLFPTYFP
jgi:CubicO group peptidase (beta-lactamase class C family)